MRHEYHCLVAGLPELFFDTDKINLTLSDFKNYLKEVLHHEDFSLIETYFWRYDNINLLKLLQNPDSDINELANLSKADFEEIFLLAKDDALYSFEREIPAYIGQFINAYKNEIQLFPGKEWENQITQLYYDYLSRINNSFMRNWFEFEMNLTNIITAFNCKKHQLKVDDELIGNNEITEKLIKSNARDFGISNEFPRLESIINALQEENIIEKEKKIDMIKWELLNDWSFFYYFTIEKVFTFTIQVEIIERWLQLDKETGQELFNNLLNSLKQSYEFSKEFTLK
jgi:hypothetical protein